MQKAIAGREALFWKKGQALNGHKKAACYSRWQACINAHRLMMEVVLWQGKS